MMYVDVEQKKWFEKHKIKMMSVICKKCGKRICTTRPFVMQGYVGFATPDHGCGEASIQYVLTPITSEGKDFWNGVLASAGKDEHG